MLALGLGSRLVVILLGMSGPSGTPEDWQAHGLEPRTIARYQDSDRALSTATRRPLIPWYRWDAVWYMKVARDGYSFSADEQSTAAFMPLLPMVMAGSSSLGLDIFWMGLIVPNLAFALGLVAFGWTAAKVTGDEGLAWRACLLLIAFPTSFFFSAPYQESLGFAFAAWGIWFWINRSPVAGLFLAFSTAARLASIATSVAIIAEWFDDKLRGRPTSRWTWPVAASGALGLILFFLYLGLHLGDPFAHLKAHQAWNRKPGLMGISAFAAQGIVSLLTSRIVDLGLILIVFFVGRAWVVQPGPDKVSERGGSRLFPLVALTVFGCVGLYFALTVNDAVLPYPQYLELLVDSYNLCFLMFLALGLSAWRRRGPFWGILTLLPIFLAAASGSPLSMTRVALSAFPGFIEGAELCGRRWCFAALIIGGLICQLYLLRRYTQLSFVA